MQCAFDSEQRLRFDNDRLMRISDRLTDNLEPVITKTKTTGRTTNRITLRSTDRTTNRSVVKADPTNTKDMSPKGLESVASELSDPQSVPAQTPNIPTLCVKKPRKESNSTTLPLLVQQSPDGDNGENKTLITTLGLLPIS